MIVNVVWILGIFLVLQPSSLAYEEEDLSFMKIYLFNWTNPHQVSNLRAKPTFEEVGPYTFLQQEERIIIYQAETFQLFYIKYHHSFVPEMSSGSLEDTIVTLNPISVFVAERTRWPGVWGQDDEPFMRVMIDQSIKNANESLFIVTDVLSLTFDGIDSPLLHMGDGDIGDIGEAIGSMFPFDRFGYFYDKKFYNVSLYGEDYQDQIHSWNDQSDLSSFYPKPCDKLTGSLGHQFPADLVLERKPLSIFSPDICRSFNFNTEPEEDGETLKYVLDKAFVGDSSVNSSNTCYNPYPDLVPEIMFEENVSALMNTTNVDLVTGLVNISQCMYNYPMYVSYPHFYIGDDDLVQSVDGLFPDVQKHQAYIKVDPLSGTVKESMIRLQYNILLRDLEYIGILENVPTVFFPILWTEVSRIFPVE